MDKVPGIPELPIDPLLPAVCAAVRKHGRVVLQAPPGAGKTTRVPPALLASGMPGRIVMLEPRRLAARAAAERMAAEMGQKPGDTVGWRMRGETVAGPETRIEVVTDGILVRMLQSDPSLDGIGALIFDEFHERALNSDLGLALAWEARNALRPDLALVVMSATLDAGPVAALLDNAPVLTAEGRVHPVETRWLDRPLGRDARFEVAAADLVARAVAETREDPGGGVLVFLPGAGEIGAVSARLTGRLPPDCALRPLHGTMTLAAQRAAIAPASTGRKIVLATAIAETSLTIEDVRVVVDCGRARRARFDAASGMGRLVTEPVTRAEAEQRRGRAGRVAPGICYRMWTRGEEGGLPAFPPAEIEAADLSGLALELALWGGAEELSFLTPPPAGPLAEARALLGDLGALDSAGRLTTHGKAMAALPLHPRLAHMLLRAGKAAALPAALMADRDPLPGAGADLADRVRALSATPDRAPAGLRRDTAARIRQETRRLARLAPGNDDPPGLGGMAALAYPDRVGLRRPGNAPRWLLSGGRGAALATEDALAGARILVATDLDGGGREARIRLAALLTEGELRAALGDRICWHEVCEWSRRERRVLARQQERLGAVILDDRPWPDTPPEALARAALEGLRDLGLGHCIAPEARRLQARVAFLRAEGAELPDISDMALLEEGEAWLLAHLAGCRDADALARFDLLAALRAGLGWDLMQVVDRLAPEAWTSPAGRRVAVDYGGEAPVVAVRLQEMFGLSTHPFIGPRRLPLRITLLSPANRPLQVTSDLPGFWASAYSEVRKEMRGRYPRHSWPENPAAAAPTLRAKPRDAG